MYNYKIRNTETRLYSDGSTFAAGKYSWKHWSANGKTWETLDKLRAHLNNIIRTHGIPEHWEIVEVVIEVRGTLRPSDIIKPEVLMKLLAKHHNMREDPEW